MNAWVQSLRRDFSLSATVAGSVCSLIGMTSSAALIFQAARHVGVDTAAASSWLGSLCIGLGLASIVLSLWYRIPILVAWSTAGSVLIATVAEVGPVSDFIGAFVLSALLIFLSGITGFFAKIMNRIPMAHASALLAGVLLQFSLGSILAFKTQPLLIGIMILSYLISRKRFPRTTMLIVLCAGGITAACTGLLHMEQLHVVPTEFHFVWPTFSLAATLSLGVPLFIVTMASQNLTGITVMRSFGFQTPTSSVLTWTGLVNLLTAPFGGFTINLAAITAAIAMGPECHPEPSKRYMAGVVSGAIYMVIGCLAGTVTSLFAAFPAEMVLAVAGLALLGTISQCLQKALSDEKEKDAAFITFVVTASGIAMGGIGSAFWGLILGSLAQFIFGRSARSGA